ncbi:hypothetical protein STAS_21001 [Striga asiatica]|uniref:Uncharacterized protein n=1 Tax=Striga asiatica TaxID=4170 RepID=A0A5A7QFM6_STRAF|nr:hypothetical protein STAS_21001 [Striga asiatica]
MAIVEDAYVYEEETHLTVFKTSLFFAGDGFTAHDSRGELVFRVDSYGPDAGDSGELVLMDASGRCILTVRRKRPSLHQRWEGYAGEGAEGKKPLFSVRRSSIIGRSGMTVEVYNPGGEYQIEGSFACRNCTILNADKEEVAEIRRKVDTTTNVVLGKDVFLLAVKPGFDGAFAMGLVLALDQIQGGDGDEAGGGADGVKASIWTLVPGLSANHSGRHQNKKETSGQPAPEPGCPGVTGGCADGAVGRAGELSPGVVAGGAPAGRLAAGGLAPPLVELLRTEPLSSLRAVGSEDANVVLVAGGVEGG